MADATLPRELFAHWFGVLADRFGKRLADPTLRAYYAYLSARLSGPDFEQAAQHIFGTWPYASWPSPLEFVQTAQRLTEGSALERRRELVAAMALGAWRDVLALARGGEDKLDTAATMAVNAMGGLALIQAVSPQYAEADLFPIFERTYRVALDDLRVEAPARAAAFRGTSERAPLKRPQPLGALVSGEVSRVKPQH